MANLYERFGVVPPKQEIELSEPMSVAEQPTVELIAPHPATMSPAMSAITGFNTSISQIPEGVSQLVANSLPFEGLQQRVREIHEQTQKDYQTAKKQNPKSAMLGYALGEIGQAATIPLTSAKLINRGKPLINHLKNLGRAVAEGAGIGGALSGAQYVEDGQNRLDNTISGGLVGGALGGAFNIGHGIYKGVASTLAKETPLTNRAAEAEAVRFGTQGIDVTDRSLRTKMSDVKRLQEQGYRDVFLSPAEASGSPVLRAQESNPKLLTKEDQIKLQKDVLSREAEAQRVLDDVVNQIVPEGNQILQNRIDTAYTEAKRHNIPEMFAYELLTTDPVISAAQKTIAKDPSLSKQTQSVAFNSVEYFDLLKKTLNDKYNSLKEKGYSTTGAKLKGIEDSINNITKVLDDTTPKNPETGISYYKEARALASRKAAKRVITDVMEKVKPFPGNSEPTANQFYEHVLASKKQFNHFLKQLDKIEDPKTKEIAVENAKSIRRILNSISDTGLNKTLNKSLTSSTRLPTGLGELSGQRARAVLGAKSSTAFVNILPSSIWYEELQKISKMSSDKAKVKRFSDFLEAQDASNMLAFEVSKNTNNHQENKTWQQ